MKIHILTPMYGGACQGRYTDSILKLVITLINAGHSVQYDFLYNESLVSRARNNLIYRFEQGDADLALFIDADQNFNHDDVIKMIDSDKEVIGAIYPMKRLNWGAIAMAFRHDLGGYMEDFSGHFAVNLLPGAKISNLEEPIKVADIGTGLLAIKRSVLEKLKPHVKKYYLNLEDSSIDLGQEVSEYFFTEITDEGYLLSEDYAFCKKWREIGGEVYAAPWVHVTHIGNYEFKGNFPTHYEFIQSKIEEMGDKPED